MDNGLDARGFSPTDASLLYVAQHFRSNPPEARPTVGRVAEAVKHAVELRRGRSHEHARPRSPSSSVVSHVSLRSVSARTAETDQTPSSSLVKGVITTTPNRWLPICLHQGRLIPIPVARTPASVYSTLARCPVPTAGSRPPPPTIYNLWGTLCSSHGLGLMRRKSQRGGTASEKVGNIAEVG